MGKIAQEYLIITNSVSLHLYLEFICIDMGKIAQEYLIITNSVYLHLYLEFICMDIGENSSRIPN